MDKADRRIPAFDDLSAATVHKLTIPSPIPVVKLFQVDSFMTKLQVIRVPESDVHMLNVALGITKPNGSGEFVLNNRTSQYQPCLERVSLTDDRIPYLIKQHHSRTSGIETHVVAAIAYIVDCIIVLDYTRELDEDETQVRCFLREIAGALADIIQYPESACRPPDIASEVTVTFHSNIPLPFSQCCAADAVEECRIITTNP
ncbi:hypothetical protein RvY_12038 [Ramazzottius varieornatus]|uniref:Uncharacterized protein n=1 Tax=Ramazzottius varieornatus TaxID=947166 RepID=A0A1D1VI60_RAMVA|nr:hypothetical protein RvY_12038 [Ramazzottius varieornatus]